MTSDLNLTTTSHRLPESVWDRAGWDGSPERARTIGRWLLTVAGIAIAADGIRRRSPGGIVAAAVGGTLACWAWTGDADATAAARHWLKDLAERAPWPWRENDRVLQMSAESFPASDAPSWTPTTGAGVKK